MYNNLIILIIFAISFFGTSAFRISIPAIAFYSRLILEASALGIGLLTSSFFAGRALFAIIAGGLADKYRFKVIYIASLCFLLNAFITYLYAFVNSVFGIIIVRFLQGALNGVSWISIQYILGSNVELSIRGRVYSIYFAIGSFGGIIGNVIYSFLSNEPLIFILMISSLLFLVASILTFGLRFIPFIQINSINHKSKDSIMHKGGGYLELVAAIPLMFIVLSVNMFGSVIRGDLIYIYMNEAFNLSRGDVANFIAFISLIALFGGYILSWLSDKINDLIALKISLFIGLIGSFLVGIKFLFGVLIGLILYYIAGSGIISISRRIAITYYRLGGMVIGLINASSNIGIVAGSFISGLIYDAYGLFELNILGMAFTFFILIMTFILIIAFIMSIIFLK